MQNHFLSEDKHQLRYYSSFAVKHLDLYIESSHRIVVVAVGEDLQRESILIHDKLVLSLVLILEYFLNIMKNVIKNSSNIYEYLRWKKIIF